MYHAEVGAPDVRIWQSLGQIKLFKLSHRFEGNLFREDKKFLSVALICSVTSETNHLQFCRNFAATGNCLWYVFV